MAESLLRPAPVNTPQELDPEWPQKPSMENGLPRYRHHEMADNDYDQSIWVESREQALAPVGEGFLFKLSYEPRPTKNGSWRL
jgi:hypothetical protein